MSNEKKYFYPMIENSLRDLIATTRPADRTYKGERILRDILAEEDAIPIGETQAYKRELQAELDDHRARTCSWMYFGREPPTEEQVAAAQRQADLVCPVVDPAHDAAVELVTQMNEENAKDRAENAHEYW